MPVPGVATQSARAKLGRGIRGQYFEFAFANVAGEPFDLERVEAIVDVTKRIR